MKIKKCKGKETGLSFQIPRSVVNTNVRIASRGSSWKVRGESLRRIHESHLLGVMLLSYKLVQEAFHVSRSKKPLFLSKTSRVG